MQVLRFYADLHSQGSKILIGGLGAIALLSFLVILVAIQIGYHKELL